MDFAILLKGNILNLYKILSLKLNFYIFGEI